MPKIIKKQEFLYFDGLLISDFLDKNFLNKIKEKGLDMDAITLIFMIKNKSNEFYPIVLSHESNKDVENKRMSIITSSNSEIVEKFIKLLEGME